MGLVPEASKAETWDSSNSKVGKKKKKKKNGTVEESGCWVRFSFRSCMSSGSKVDSFMSGTSASCGKLPCVLFPFLFLNRFLFFGSIWVANPSEGG